MASPHFLCPHSLVTRFHQSQFSLIDLVTVYLATLPPPPPANLLACANGAELVCFVETRESEDGG